MPLTRSRDGVLIDRDKYAKHESRERVERGLEQRNFTGGRYGDFERSKQSVKSKNGEQDLRQKSSTRERTKADKNLQLLEGLGRSARGLSQLSVICNLLILHNCAAILSKAPANLPGCMQRSTHPLDSGV